jgi:hypothetical protein
MDRLLKGKKKGTRKKKWSSKKKNHLLKRKKQSSAVGRKLIKKKRGEKLPKLARMYLPNPQHVYEVIINFKENEKKRIKYKVLKDKIKK